MREIVPVLVAAATTSDEPGEGRSTSGAELSADGLLRLAEAAGRVEPVLGWSTPTGTVWMCSTRSPRRTRRWRSRPDGHLR